MPATTSVVMVSYHTGPVLWMAMQAVLSQPDCKELILVDNGNPPDVVLRLREFARDNPRLILLSGQGNIGFAKGCNTGARAATGNYLLLLNPDCILPPQALGRMAEALEAHPEAKLAGCFLMNPDGSEQRGGRRNLLTPWTALVESLSLHRFMPDKYKPARLNVHEQTWPETVHEIPAISGAFMFMRKADFSALGGMDERYFLHVEDLDFCMRVAKSGGKTICAPDVKVLHYRSTSDAPSYFIEWNKTKGFVRYFYSHFRKTYMPGVLELISLGTVIRFVLKGGLSYLRRYNILYVNPMEREMRRIWVMHYLLTNVLRSERLKGRRFLVSGAVGQVGLCVVGRLLQEGADVVASTRSDTIPLHHERLSWMFADFTNPNFRVPEDCPPVLIHTAPLWVLIPKLEEFIQAGVKHIITFSSTAVFYKANSTDAHERDVAEKLETAENALDKICRAHNVVYTLLRPTLIYGVGLDVNISRMASFIKRFGFCPVYPPASGKRQPVHADDLALAVLSTINANQSYGKSYNLGGGETVSYRNMAERIFDALGKNRRVIKLPFLPDLLDKMGQVMKRPLNGEMARRMNRDFAFDYSDATRDFGYQPRVYLAAGKRDLGEF